jgi:nitroreductase
MSQTNPVLDFLLTRRSRPAKLLKAPAPQGVDLTTLLTAAARVPDHGKLEPWRFIVIEKPACERMADVVRARGEALGKPEDKIAKGVSSWANAPMIVAVVSSPKPSDAIPRAEQVLSSGAVCLSLVNAALASGWGAAWMTGYAAFDRVFLETELGLTQDEEIAGFVHLGRCDTPPSDRPRPDVAALTRVIGG